jgi:hypothetical protein
VLEEVGKVGAVVIHELVIVVIDLFQQGEDGQEGSIKNIGEMELAVKKIDNSDKQNDKQAIAP